ncbi:ATP-dependent helicase HrpA [Archangium violaceum]|nr:ATP-dependent helicase HrpA [Archangium violaceum]
MVPKRERRRRARRPRQRRGRERTARVDQAGLLQRTFAVDVFAYVRCGGRRRVLAYVEHLGLPTAGASLAAARGPPQAAWC